MELKMWSLLTDMATMKPRLPDPSRNTRWPARLVGRSAGRRSTLGDTTTLRLRTEPPSLRHAPASLWARLKFWLLAPAPHEAAPPLNRLPPVRADFIAALADLAGTDADELRHRIGQARSLRELWHLRSDVFRIVGVVLSQAEAQRRVERLGRHFPQAASSSRFGGL